MQSPIKQHGKLPGGAAPEAEAATDVAAFPARRASETGERDGRARQRKQTTRREAEPLPLPPHTMGSSLPDYSHTAAQKWKRWASVQQLRAVLPG